MSEYKFETLQLHVGQEQADPATDARAVPIYQTTSYVFRNSQHAADRFGLADAGNIYGRLTNSTQDVFEKRIAALEGGVAALATASGAAAITYTIEALAQAGDHIVAQKTIYGGSYNLLAHTLTQFGVNTTFVDAHDLAQVEAAIQPNTKAVYLETLGNPNSDIPDIDAIAAIAHKHGLPLVIDNTFGTPYLIRPIEHGADIVVHSATKFISGHGDATGGVAVGRAELLGPIRAAGMGQLGGCLSPHEAVMLLRGLKTLPLRVEAACTNAEALARWLQAQPAVARVYYPGLATHPGHGVAAQQMRRFGAILSLDLRGGRAAARQFLDGLRIVTQAVSVGDVDSLACHPASTTHHSVPEPVRLDNGVSDALVRMSVGIEDGDDLLADVAQALARV